MLLTLMLLNGAFAACHTDRYYNDCPDIPGLKNDNWMRTVPDNTPITRMTIPFSHDTVALLNQPRWRTQSLDLRTQLRVGYRGFDFRILMRDNTAKIYHAAMDTGYTLPQVLTLISAWLKKHDSEGVIINIQSEATLLAKPLNGGHKCTLQPKTRCRKMGDVIRDELQRAFGRHPDQFVDTVNFFHGDTWSKNVGKITMEKWRGKVIVIKQWDELKPVRKGEVSFYNKNQIRSFYQLTTGIFLRFVEIYKRRCRQHMLDAEKHTDKLTWTHTNVGSPDVKPITGAKKSNKWTAHTVSANMNDHRGFGLVSVDFPGEVLLKTLLEANPDKNIKCRTLRRKEGCFKDCEKGWVHVETSSFACNWWNIFDLKYQKYCAKTFCSLHRRREELEAHLEGATYEE